MIRPAAPLSFIPSPTQGVWHLGPFPLRAYALCIMVGIIVAVWWGERRFQARGARPGVVLDVAAWAVPFGIVGGRLYHVITSWQPYFGSGGHPVQAFYIWQGGLGIWGAVALGAVGAWIGCRRAGVLLPPFADAIAPAIVLAQGIGRWGNWFNNELYGSPTTRPWGLQIHEWDSTLGRAVVGPDGHALVLGTFQPTFLYESIWDLGTAGAVVWIDRRFRLGHGRAFAVYGLLYTVGRFWIETLRVDPANHILGLRLNLWTAVIVGLAALSYLVLSSRSHPGRESSVERVPAAAGPLEGPGDEEPVADLDDERVPAAVGGAGGDTVRMAIGSAEFRRAWQRRLRGGPTTDRTPTESQAESQAESPRDESPRDESAPAAQPPDEEPQQGRPSDVQRQQEPQAQPQDGEPDR